MNLSDTITTLLKGQTAGITLGMNQDKRVWAVCQHIVQTGPSSTMEITHKADASNVVDVITQIVKQYEQAEYNRPMVVTPPDRKMPKIYTP